MRVKKANTERMENDLEIGLKLVSEGVGGQFVYFSCFTLGTRVKVLLRASAKQLHQSVTQFCYRCWPLTVH